MTVFIRESKPALKDPSDKHWGRCPYCQQSAQAKLNDRLVCHRCNWVEPKARSFAYSTE
jgi:ribosomal protein S27AE